MQLSKAAAFWVRDEIALFDTAGIIDNQGTIGEIFLGSGIWTGEQLEITAIGGVDLSALGGPILPGYSGGTMALKIFDVSKEIKYNADYTISFGSGSFNGLYTTIDSITFESCSSE